MTKAAEGMVLFPMGTPGRIMNWVADIPPILGNDNLTWNKNVLQSVAIPIILHLSD